jgi:hypothetical protein
MIPSTETDTGRKNSISVTYTSFKISAVLLWHGMSPSEGCTISSNTQEMLIVND